MSIQTSHYIYDLAVSPSSASRLYEYIACKEFINKGDRVLDFGCNSGTGIDAIYDPENEYYGIDVVPELKALFAEKYHDKPNVNLAIVTEGEVPYADDFFDVVMAMNLIEHLEDPEPYLRELKRITKPGGRVLVATVNRKYRLYPWQKPWNPYHFTEYSESSLRRVLARHFDTIDLRGVAKSPPFFPDYAAIAPKRKFTLGIKNPVIHTLSHIKSVFTGRKLATDAPPAPENEKSSSSAPVEIETFDLSKFEEAFKHIHLTQHRNEPWIELFAICSTKS